MVYESVTMELSCVGKKQLLEILSQKEYFCARVAWLWSLKNSSDGDNKKNTIDFLKSLFQADVTKEWTDCLRLLWTDIQKIWPEKEDFSRIFTTTIQSPGLDTERKDLIISSLLQYTNDRNLIRELYRIAPENSHAEYYALEKMLKNINNRILNLPPQSNNKPYLLSIIDDIPPARDIIAPETQGIDSERTIEELNHSIRDKYTFLNLFITAYSNIEQEIIEIKSKSSNSGQIKEICSRYGLNEIGLDDAVVQLKKYYESQKEAKENYLQIQQNISQKKAELIEFIKKAENKPDKPNSEIQNPFGYVDKPIERFLTYCEDISIEFLQQCISIYLNKSQEKLIINNEKSLPYWILEEFEEWWEEKYPSDSLDRGERERHAYLSINNRLNEIHIVIPQQSFVNEDGLEHVDLVVSDDSQIIAEHELPLYHNGEKLSSHEISLNLPSPSSFYQVQINTKTVKIDGFTDDTNYLIFDSDSHRQISKGTVPKKQFIIISQKNLSISPESAILENGQFFGNWKDFSYYIVDPTFARQVIIDIPPEPPSQKFIIQIDSKIFDKNILIDDKKVILGTPPQISIKYDDEKILSDTVLSIHPHEQSSQNTPLFYELTGINDFLTINKDNNICSIDLSNKSLLGKEPVGLFLIRIRNKSCKIDTRIECVFLPDLNIHYSEPCYLPKKSNNIGDVKISINSKYPLDFIPKTQMKVDTGDKRIIIHSILQQTIEGQFSYKYAENRVFEANLTIQIPHLAWRFEDKSNDTQLPLQRSAIVLSENEFECLGDNLGISIFLPESFNGPGSLTMVAHTDYILSHIVNGKGAFDLASYSDVIRGFDDEVIQFEFSMDLPQGKLIRCPLFRIKRWIVRLRDPIQIYKNESENWIIDAGWTESFQAQDRYFVLWKLGKKENDIVKVCEERIPEKTLFIHQEMERTKLLPGIYYLQFFQKKSEWESISHEFPGEKTPNIFQFGVEIRGEELLKTADTLFDKKKYSDAFILYEELESQNPELGNVWKHKIINRFIISRDHNGAIDCFGQIIQKESEFKEIAIDFITFRLIFDILPKKDLDCHNCEDISTILINILKSSHITPKRIIQGHKNDIKRHIETNENVSDHEKRSLLHRLEIFFDLE